MIYTGILGSSPSWAGILIMHFSRVSRKNETKKGFEKAEKMQLQKYKQESFNIKELREHLNSPELGRHPELKLYAKK